MSAFLTHSPLSWIRNGLVATGLILVASLVASADPQSTDTTAQAKQHYQNAVAAIAKSDWETAKGELLQAEKLAPKNALVHYDLALAYSHTAQVELAQTELNQALQIGLPAEQRQVAEGLKKRLASQTQVPKANVDNATPKSPQVSTEVHDVTIHVKPSATGDEPSTPTIAETLDYLNDRVDSTFVRRDSQYVPGKFSIFEDSKSFWSIVWSRWTALGTFGNEWASALGQATDYLTSDDGMAGYARAKVIDLNADSITFDPKSGELTILCKSDGACWQMWGETAPAFNKARDFLLKTNTGSDNAKLLGELKGLNIPTTGDGQIADRFMRALQHLMRLLQSFPQNRNFGSDDPFAK